MKYGIWVRLSDKSSGDNSMISFALCVWKVLSVLDHNTHIFVAVCFVPEEFSLSRDTICLPSLNVTTVFRRLDLHWTSVCSAPSEVQFNIYCPLSS